MAEGEPVYRKCPFYANGDAECCGAHHDAQRKRYEDYTIELVYTDGRPSHTVHAFVLRPPYLEYGNWITIKMEAEEVQKAVLDWPYLTTETSDKIRNIHSGIFEASLDEKCPYRRGSS